MFSKKSDSDISQEVAKTLGTKVEVIRDEFFEDCTLGKLYIDGKYFCETLEDKVREIPGQDVKKWKIKAVTAIPVGVYKMILSFSNRFQKELPELLDVPGFAGIRMHSGNTGNDSEGCILLGMSRVGHSISRSRDAKDAFMAAVKDKKDIVINISGLPE